MRALSWSIALCCLGVARADTIVLKDGRIITGRVVERGDRVFVERPQGGTSFPRNDVARIETDAGEPAPPPDTFDTIVLKDGRIVRGEVTVAPDGHDVIVRMGERGEVRHPRSAVAVIRWRDGRQDAPGLAPGEAGSDLQKTVDRLVTDLSSGDEAVAVEARRELLALGPFARSYLDALKGKHERVLGPLLENLDRVDAIRRVLPAKVEETVPRLTERLVSSSAEDREAVLKAVVMEVPAEVGPLLLYVVEHEKDGLDPERNTGSQRVKAYCVSQLAALRCFDELGQVLKLTDGPLRLAAAFALGDAGVYAGVPIVIEALRISGKGAADKNAQEIREVANTKLCEWTKQQFGFRAAATQAERDAAVKRWEVWWAENGDELLRRSLIARVPEMSGARSTEQELSQGKKRWDEATKLLATTMEPPPANETPEEAEAREKQRRQIVERAADELGKALEMDPGLSTARMTRAVLLYEELNRPRDAEKELDAILARAKHDPGDPDAARKFAYFHQARIAASEGAFQRAVVRFSQAINYDERFVEGWEGQGDAHMALAVQEAGDRPAEEDAAARRDAMAAARAAYQSGIESVLFHEEELKRIMRDMLVEAPESSSEGQAIASVRRSSRNLQVSRARLQAKLGRALAAGGQDRKALEAFQAALALDGDNKEYDEAVKTWGKVVGDALPPSPEPPPPPPGEHEQGEIPR